MSPSTDRPLEDGEFEAYLRGESPLSRQHRAVGDDAVPGHLDARVLEQARAALQARAAGADRQDELARVRQRRRRLVAWSLPTALAASALLVVSVVIRSGVQHEMIVLPQKSQQAVESPTAGRAPQPVASALPEAAEPRSETRKAAEDELARKKLRMSNEGLAARTSKEAARSAARVDAIEAAPKPAAAPAIAVPPPPSVELSAVGSSDATTAPAAVAPPAAAAKTVQPQLHGAANPDLDEIAVARMRALAGPRNTVRNSESGGAADASDSTDLTQPPEQWLEHIRELRRDGDDRQADREWRRFRKQYPDYAVADTDLARAKP